VNCNLGAGLKDSSRVTIDHCTYYGNGTSVACFEKNEGDAGGNAEVTNSILSNAYDATFLCDSKSTIDISYSASDNDTLPANNKNLFANPEFVNPNFFDFNLEANSVCAAAGADGKNLGAGLKNTPGFNQLFISGIAYWSNTFSEVNEFLELSNSGNTAIDISGYEFTKGVSFKFPAGTVIGAGEKMYVAYNSGIEFWQNKDPDIYQWERGRLADEGETIRLQTPQGIVVDQIFYKQDTSWPDATNGEAISLKSETVDNHFGANWKITKLNVLVNNNAVSNLMQEINIFPNPTTGIVTVSGIEDQQTMLKIYNTTGALVKSVSINSSNSQLNLSNLNEGIYLVKGINFTKRLLIAR